MGTIADQGVDARVRGRFGRRVSWRRRWIVLVGVLAVVAIAAEDASAGVVQQQEPEAAVSPVEQAEPLAAGPLPRSEPRDLAGELSVDGLMPPAGGGVEGAVSAPDGRDRVRELTEVRSEGSETFLLESGQRQTEFFASPKWYRGPDGAWVEVDPRVVRSGDSKDAPVVTAGVGFSATFGVSGEGVALSFEGRDLRFRARGRTDVLPELDAENAAVVWYREVWPEVDIRYTVTATGVKEDFVVRSAKGFETPDVFVVDVESEGALVADPARPASLVAIGTATERRRGPVTRTVPRCAFLSRR